MSALTDHLDTYIATRRALGYRMDEAARLVADFVGDLEGRGGTTITTDAALAWATMRPGTSDARAATRLSVVRHFALFLQGVDDRVEVPPKGLLAARSSRIQPYLYSQEEITALLAAARRLPRPIEAATFETAIGLLAATGLRPGEAWRLDRDDVEISTRLLTVRASKLGKSRQLPLHASTVAALARYARRRDRLCREASTPSFFVSEKGGRLERSRPSVVFRRLCVVAGVAAPPTRRPPRLYDLRHSFAVATLLDWHAEGIDVESRLPVLSAYLGHLSPKETYWYLQASPELMATVGRRLERFLGEPS